ncbi:hypothetical protein HDU93_003477 [Gonapodya sp. JEL0774]|nr:hypothetical protein HDU93_003477 [Gonapodya sp. JEL0774]
MPTIQQHLQSGWLALKPLLKKPSFWFTVVLITVIVVSGAILFMVLCNFPFARDFPKSQKDQWIEITSQILNACFTLQALIVVWPRLKLGAMILQLWRLRNHNTGSVDRVGDEGTRDDPKDAVWDRRAAKLREELFGDDRIKIIRSEPIRNRAVPGGSINPVRAEKPKRTSAPGIAKETTTYSDSSVETDGTVVSGDSEATSVWPNSSRIIPLTESRHFECSLQHASWIVLFLNLNHLFQWPMAAVMWGWATDYSNRPSWAVYVFLILSFTCGAVGGVSLARVLSAAKKSEPTQ